MMFIGAGIPFFWIAALGGAETSAAHVGALIAGTAPISVSLLSYFIEKVRYSAHQIIGLCIIIAGVLLLVGTTSITCHGNIIKGTALLLTGSMLWGFNTIGIRRSRLDALSNTMLLALPSFLVLIVLLSVGVIHTSLTHIDHRILLPYILIQGIGVGIVSSLTYAIAISRIGATRSAVIGSLSPTLTTIAAVPLLGESLTMGIGIGITSITAGVVLANYKKNMKSIDQPQPQ